MHAVQKHFVASLTCIYARQYFFGHFPPRRPTSRSAPLRLSFDYFVTQNNYVTLGSLLDRVPWTRLDGNLPSVDSD